MFDIYKIICFLGEKLYYTPGSYLDETVDLFENLFKFFKEGSLLDRVKRRIRDHNDYYSAPEKFRSISHGNYIDWLYSTDMVEYDEYKVIYDRVPKDAVLAPLGRRLSTCEFFDITSTNKVPENSLEYCEVYSLLESKNTDESKRLMRWLNEHFDAEKHFNKEYKKINKSIQNAKKIINGQNVIFTLDRSTDFKNEKFIKDYKHQVVLFSELKKIVGDMESFIRSNMCSLKNQGKYEENEKNITSVIMSMSNLRRYIQKQGEILKENVELLKKVDLNPRSFWAREHKSFVMSA
jgi:hypothetical protein